MKNVFHLLSLSLDQANLVPLNRHFFCREIECQVGISRMPFDTARTAARSIEFTKKEKNEGKTQVLEEL